MMLESHDDDGVGSACGKVILLGEHAVVYGVPAIAAGVELGVRAHARAIGKGPSRLRVPAWGCDVSENSASNDLSRAFRALLDVARPAHPVEVEAEVDLPPGGGLGCSAAMSVAVARAIEPGARPARVTERAFAWERVFHGNPSGIDAAIAASGGVGLFEKGRPLQPIYGPALTLAVGHSGILSSTKTMVDVVARQRARRPEAVSESFLRIHALVRSARQALEIGDRFELGRLMNANQMILRALSLSTPEIELMCGLARDAGALGAKLTGAGGGGCVVALVGGQASAERVLASWHREGFDAFITRVAQVQPEEALAVANS